MSLKDIVGQDRAIRLLRSMIEKDEIDGSYLFFGPMGVGKRTLSIEFAKAINCEKKGLDACEECISCGKIKSLNHPDLFIIQKEKESSFIKIDRIRDIIYQASLKPYEARKKIFIITEAEDMNEESQNALLKILEEPRENQVFILTTSCVSGILPTVVSRCKAVKFNLLSQSQIQELLIKRHGFNEGEAVLFSHMALGSHGRAAAFKDKDGIRERDRMLNDFFFRKRAIFREEVCDDKKYSDLEESLQMLLFWYRDLLVAKFIEDKALFLNVDRMEEIFSYSARFSADKLGRDISSVMNTMNYVRRNINPKMALFNMALELERQ
ncbi:MAG: DNA polymerase III subunit delta' [Omnitrophica bacterium GWA2_41_15]|nr:MAG: DNA polymerase III subunit delta' [Omnitrophica bacterium GWA2_41_15]HAZ10249.1 DNA polymerase III subunit delta' [Candidatus Omnitrophota bacterium]